jgi:ATP-binding cassette subfamily G (WHITE) protein 2
MHLEPRRRPPDPPIQVTLLSCGRLMYAGACDGLVEWFKSVGFQYEPSLHGIVSDWVLDLVACSKHKPAHLLGAPTISSRREVRALSVHFVEHWLGRRAARLRADLRALAALQAARRPPPRCTHSRPHSSGGGGGAGGGGIGSEGGAPDAGSAGSSFSSSSSSSSSSGSISMGNGIGGSRRAPPPLRATSVSPWSDGSGDSSTAFGSSSCGSPSGGSPGGRARRAAAALPACALDAERAALLRPPTWLQQFRWSFYREFKMITRNPAEVAGRTLTNTWVALVMGLLYYGIPHDAAFLRCKVNILLNVLAFFCLMPYISMSLYTAGKATYLADVSAKLYTPSAYYLAKVGARRGGGATWQRLGWQGGGRHWLSEEIAIA